MSYCSDQGIPHSEYLKWSPEDRAKHTALLLERSARCEMCGTAPWEWEENRFAYTPVDELCQGCYQKGVFSESESSSLPGTNVKLVPTTKMMSAKAKVRANKRAKKIQSAKEEAEGGGRPDESAGQRRPHSGHHGVRQVPPVVGPADGGPERFAGQAPSEGQPAQ